MGFCLFFHSYLLYGLKFLLSYLQTHQACVESKDESVEDFICWDLINFYYFFFRFSISLVTFSIFHFSIFRYNFVSLSDRFSNSGLVSGFSHSSVR